MDFLGHRLRLKFPLEFIWQRWTFGIYLEEVEVLPNLLIFIFIFNGIFYGKVTSVAVEAYITCVNLFILLVILTWEKL